MKRQIERRSTMQRTALNSNAPLAISDFVGCVKRFRADTPAVRIATPVDGQLCQFTPTTGVSAPKEARHTLHKDTPTVRSWSSGFSLLKWTSTKVRLMRNLDLNRRRLKPELQ